MMSTNCLIGQFLALLVILTPYTAGAESCKDNSGNCLYWKNQGFCATSSQYVDYMKNTCAKACGFCKVNPCVELPCKNGGSCSVTSSGFSCKCKSGYEGTTCALFDPCAKKPCKNGGSCSKSGLEFACKCATGFEGKTCETVPAKVCQNSLHYDTRCPAWKEAKFCDKSNKYFGFMTDHCSKECGFCVPCKDKTSDPNFCSLYKSYCQDEFYGATVRKNCQATCKTCGEIPCGQGPDKLGRVVGGTNVERNSWRWQAQLKKNGVFFCGGTLVAPQWVLTAAHCLRNIPASVLEITLGDHDRSKEEGSEQRFNVTQIVRNPNYDPSTKNSDIALLKLSSKAVLNKHVTLACLPTEPPTKGQPCYVTGWGRTVGLGESSDILQEAKLPVVTNKECALLNTRRPITKEMLCAGNGRDFTKSQSACQGDSGGPLVCQKGTSWAVHGVVSWGSSRCIASESYTVFARVTEFVDWIKSTTT